ncbi:hypothetical protein JTE90_007385 [Oedothorax gibbosus]|uniref:Uncharacterized protein n=1 Tax=Oedothorax gibbosus TaxID=931172 RepID=A0AAV6TSC5_9ARAC|nr:hypothetical protein JTE90_007385 [Oedothorax gibbosus]
MAYISSKFVDPKLNWPDVVIHLASGSPASDYALVLKDAIGMTDQVLVTKPDFYNPDSRYNLKSTVLELIGLNTGWSPFLGTPCIIPVVNTNDVVVPPEVDYTSTGLKNNETGVSAASWALERGIAVVICNGTNEQAVSRIVQGKRIGTFFTDHKSLTNTVETHAVNAKKGSRRV